MLIPTASPKGIGPLAEIVGDFLMAAQLHTILFTAAA